MSDDTSDEKVQGHENIRRVYALPSEMVDRIVKFQQQKGLSSEVEAVRRLLDEALKSRDDLDTIINRLLAKLAQTKIASEAAREVLAGHPLVSSIEFNRDSVSFVLKNSLTASVYENGYVRVPGPRGDGNEWVAFDEDNPFAGGSQQIPF